MNLCIIEDQPDLLANLRVLFAGEEGVTLVGSFDCAEAAIDANLWEQCDILLVDIDLPGISGVELIQQLHPLHPQLQILVHTISESRATVFSALKAGAMGYLLKCGSPRELIQSLQTLHLGGAPMSPKIARKVILEMQTKTGHHAAETTLAECELQVLTGIARGQTYKEIAATMNRSSHTVHVHIKSAYKKLQACNRADAIQKARSLGVI
jgi:two-component system NarL family response regulator